MLCGLVENYPPSVNPPPSGFVCSSHTAPNKQPRKSEAFLLEASKPPAWLACVTRVSGDVLRSKTTRAPVAAAAARGGHRQPASAGFFIGGEQVPSGTCVCDESRRACRPEPPVAALYLHLGGARVPPPTRNSGFFIGGEQINLDFLMETFADFDILIDIR